MGLRENCTEHAQGCSSRVFLVIFFFRQVVFEWPKGILHYETSLKMDFLFQLVDPKLPLEMAKNYLTQNYLYIFLGAYNPPPPIPTTPPPSHPKELEKCPFRVRFGQLLASLEVLGGFGVGPARGGGSHLLFSNVPPTYCLLTRHTLCPNAPPTPPLQHCAPTCLQCTLSQNMPPTCFPRTLFQRAAAITTRLCLNPQTLSESRTLFLTRFFRLQHF